MINQQHQQTINEVISGPYVSCNIAGTVVSAGKARGVEGYISFVASQNDNTQYVQIPRAEALQAFKLIEGLS